MNKRRMDKCVINTCQSIGVTWLVTKQQLGEQFELSEETAEEKMQLYWKV